MRIAVAACGRSPDLDDDWPLLRAALAGHGVTATAAAWSDPAVDWASFALVVIRGTWDYFHRVEEFLAWVRRVEASTTLVNPASAVVWNTDKRYLMDLEAAGVPVVATSLVGPGQRWRPPEGDFVIKPSVSAGGFETARYRPDEGAAAERQVQRLHQAGRVVMVQPYLPAVDREGETALIYLGGRFSHAINKGPLLEAGAGVDDRLWARERIVAVEPTPTQVRVAEDALAAAVATTRSGPVTYARVDLMTDRHAGPVVSEVELVEPGLFLRYAPDSVARFAEVLVGLL